MKSRWTVVVLAASLALNAAALGAFAYRRYMDWRREQMFFRHLEKRAKGRLTSLFRETEPRMDSLRQVYWNARRQLGELGFQDRPDSLEVERLLGIIANTHKEMNRLVFVTTRTIESMYPARTRERIQRRLREMWESPHGPKPRRGQFRGRRMPPPEPIPGPPGIEPPPEPPPGQGR